MINDLLPLDFDGASDGMLPTISYSLPSASGISSLLGATLDDRQPVRLLPFGRHPAPVLPLVSRGAWATQYADKIGGGNLGKVFVKCHGRILPLKKKYAMQKIKAGQAYAMHASYVHEDANAMPQDRRQGNHHSPPPPPSPWNIRPPHR